MSNFRLTFGKRVSMFICVVVICMFIASAIISIIARHGLNLHTLRVITLVQDVILFIFPPIICAAIYAVNPVRFLRISDSVPLGSLVLAVATLVCAIPAMNWIIYLNENMTLPESLKGFEEWMRASEANAADSVKLLTGGTSVGSLIMSVLIVGVLAGFSEEIFFRGGVQRLLATKPMNIHWAIWITAFIFSAIHLQFFGFLPRLLLGAFFGYLLYWTGTLWIPIACHVFNNSVIAIATWMNSRGAAESSVVDEIGRNFPTQWPWILASFLLTIVLLTALYKSRQSVDLDGSDGASRT